MQFYFRSKYFSTHRLSGFPLAHPTSFSFVPVPSFCLKRPKYCQKKNDLQFVFANFPGNWRTCGTVKKTARLSGGKQSAFWDLPWGSRTRGRLAPVSKTSTKTILMKLVCVIKWWRVKLGNNFTCVLSKF